VIPGHNDVPYVWSDLVDYSGFYNDIADQAKASQASGRSVEQFVGSYTVPSQFRGFAAEPDRLRATVQYIFDGR
jgi:hypothetical protein